MASVIITITKETLEQPWIKFNNPIEAAKFFTPDELKEVVGPYKALLESLPGFITSRIIEVTDLTMKIARDFDTIENATKARAILANPEEGSVADKYRKLFAQKRIELGVNYTYDYNIIE